MFKLKKVVGPFLQIVVHFRVNKYQLSSLSNRYLNHNIKYYHHTNPQRRDDALFMQRNQSTLRKQDHLKQTHKQAHDETQKISQKILAEARKIAELEIQKMALEVLSEATVIARWEQNPFYIT
jgi:ribosome-binding protein aMBF1 (putative translation factor)